MIDKAEVLRLVRQLPTIPAVVGELQDLLAQPNVSVGRVDQLICTDAALTANVLRFANSAAFGLSRKVTDIAQAVTLVGFRVLGNLVHSAVLSNAIPEPFPGYRISADQFLHHSLSVAIMTESLSRTLKLPQGLPYFTAGLLHDIGKLVLGTFVAAHDRELSTRLHSEQLTFVQLEREVLGVDHAQAAAWVGEHWQLPRALVAAAEHHHAPGEADPELQPIVDLVHVADMAAHCLGLGADMGELARRIESGACARLRVTSEVLESAVSGSVEQLVNRPPSDSGESRAPQRQDNAALGILVVDDSSIIRQMVGKSLSLAGLPPHQVFQASDGVQALELLRDKSHQFALVLADIHMPRMTGTALVANMVADADLKHIPVVIMSSDGNNANHERLKQLGVRALLKKPFRPEQLGAVVGPILGEHTRQP
jgi:putative nucleotidyltransferase with HDIG domain